MSSTSTKRPEEVLNAAKLAAAVSGAVTGVGALLVLAGYATTEQIREWAVASGAAVVAVGALLGAVMPIITALRARERVTPLSDPRDGAGRPLVVDGELGGPVTDRPVLDEDAGGPVDIVALQYEYFGPGSTTTVLPVQKP